MAWWSTKHKAGGRAARETDALFEGLEPRTLLFAGPMFTSFPSLNVLENPNDTVVRMVTSHGNVDIELYDLIAPVTVANFKKYITDGDYDEMMFHRLIKDFVLQGGGFGFDDKLGELEVPTDPAIVNEFNKSNVERTIAMAKLPGNPDSATSQWYFNLKDNSGEPPDGLDFQNGGFTVFGRVVQGWSVIQAIAALSTADLDDEINGNTKPGLYNTVPVTAAFQEGQALKETMIARLLDIEIIKPFGSPKYFEQSVYYPEGFRGPDIVERLDVVNAFATGANTFQVIVRYASGVRDQVIYQGTLGPGDRQTIKISDFNAPGQALVRPGVGYAIEVRATRPIAATLNHRDSGVTLEESFHLASGFTAGGLQNWTFGDGENGPNFESYLVWQNLTAANIKVFVAVYPDGGTVKTFAFDLEAFRRGGVELHNLPSVPDKRFSVKISSTQPIMAAMSQYENATGVTNGHTASGVILGGRSEGVLAGARIPVNGSAHLSILFTANSPAVVVVSFDFFLLNGDVLSGNAVVLSGSKRRVDYDLSAANVNLPENQFFTIRYRTTGAAAVSVHFVTEMAGDTLSTPFSVASNGQHWYADGFMDPLKVGTAYAEIISVFNPYTKTSIKFSYQLKYHFSDGTVVTTPAAALGALRRVDVRTQDHANVMAKINSAPAHRFYSIEVVTFQLNGSTPFKGAAISQLTRIHANWGQTMTTLPGLDPRFGPIYMDSPTFNA